VLPPLLYLPECPGPYLLVAETFAPVAEGLLFALAFWSREDTLRSRVRDCAVIVAANLASFLVGLSFW
jgi:hypothetical protein